MDKRDLELLRRAARAPSSHNTQPWRFRVTGTDIDLFADRGRALPVNDPSDRELTISCGCALLNLRVAAAAQGSGAHVAPWPDPEQPDWLARVSITPHTEPSQLDVELARFIESRHTYRKPFPATDIARITLDTLVDAARSEQAWLRPISESVRGEVAALVAEGDSVQWADPHWRRELAAWMRPWGAGDGLTMPGAVAPLARYVVRRFDMGRRVGAADHRRTMATPLLAALGTECDEPRSWLSAGQALQRVLLTACKFRLQASYFNQPLQVASLRPRLQRLTGDGFVQIVLGMGHPVAAPRATPRRPVGDTLARAI